MIKLHKKSLKAISRLKDNEMMFYCDGKNHFTIKKEKDYFVIKKRYRF